MAKAKSFAVHPGEIFKTEFMKPLGVSGNFQVSMSFRTGRNAR